jgi:hypothetical protein
MLCRKLDIAGAQEGRAVGSGAQGDVGLEGARVPKRWRDWIRGQMVKASGVR